MKTRLLIIIGIIFSAGIVFLPVHAIETFDGKASFERVPEIIIPDIPNEFEIKFHYVGKPYVLYDLTPTINVNPESAIPFVKIQTTSSELQPSVPGRIPVSITVDKNIHHQKIFLSVSYEALGYGDKQYKSSWSDFLTLEIGGNQHSAVSETSNEITQDGSVFPRHGYQSSQTMSPLKQFKSGVPSDEVKCRESLILVPKNNGSPACIHPFSVPKLYERGWIDSSNLSQFKEIFCQTNQGKWSEEFHNCVGGSMPVSCDDIGASELTQSNVFGKTITQEGQCISHEKFCSLMGGTSACMSDEQKGDGRDVCIAVCEFGN